jgi:hypothetical protein
MGMHDTIWSTQGGILISSHIIKSPFVSICFESLPYKASNTNFSYITQITDTTKFVVVGILWSKNLTNASLHLPITEFLPFAIDFLIRIMEDPNALTCQLNKV